MTNKAQTPQFQLVPTSEVYTPRPRGTFNIQGPEKSLKTSLALSVEEPIYVMAFEKRTLDTAYIEAQKGKKIFSIDLTGWVDEEARTTASQKTAKETWTTFFDAYYWALGNPEIRSVVIDPFSWAYDVGRMAKLGKLAQVQPWLYGPFYSELATIFWKASGSDKNLVVVHKLKPEYVKDQKSGNYVLDGWADVADQVQVNIATWKNQVDGSFHAYVQSSGVNAYLNGLDLAQMSVPWSLQWLVQCMWNEGVAAMEIQRAVAARQSAPAGG